MQQGLDRIETRIIQSIDTAVEFAVLKE